MDPEERPTVEPLEHSAEDADEVASRPIGTRSFIYGTKTLAASVVALLLTLFVDDVFAAGFWALPAAGLLGRHVQRHRAVDDRRRRSGQPPARRPRRPPGDRGRAGAMKITVGSVAAT